MFDEMNNFHFYSLLFYVIDVSPTGTLDCEISAQKCQPPLETKTRTVTPKDHKVTFDCSIKNGGKVISYPDLPRPREREISLFSVKNRVRSGYEIRGKVQDMTWQDLERNLSANNGLFLHQNNAKDKKSVT